MCTAATTATLAAQEEHEGAHEDEQRGEHGKHERQRPVGQLERAAKQRGAHAHEPVEPGGHPVADGRKHHSALSGAAVRVREGVSNANGAESSAQTRQVERGVLAVVGADDLGRARVDAEVGAIQVANAQLARLVGGRGRTRLARLVLVGLVGERLVDGLLAERPVDVRLRIAVHVADEARLATVATTATRHVDLVEAQRHLHVAHERVRVDVDELGASGSQRVGLIAARLLWLTAAARCLFCGQKGARLRALLRRSGRRGGGGRHHLGLVDLSLVVDALEEGDQPAHVAVAHERIVVHVEGAQGEVSKGGLVERAQQVAVEAQRLERAHVVEGARLDVAHAAAAHLQHLERRAHRLQRVPLHYRDRIVAEPERLERRAHSLGAEQSAGHARQLVAGHVQVEHVELEVAEGVGGQLAQPVVRQVNALHEVEVAERERAEEGEARVTPHERAHDVRVDGERLPGRAPRALHADAQASAMWLCESDRRGGSRRHARLLLLLLLLLLSLLLLGGDERAVED